MNNFLVKFSNERIANAGEIKETNMLIKVIKKRYDETKKCFSAQEDAHGEV